MSNLNPRDLGRVVRREQSSIRTICVVRPVKVVRSQYFASPQNNKN